MAVIPCSQCGAEMHTYHLRCPKCDQGNPRTRGDLAGLVFGLLMAAGLVLFVATR